MNDNYGGLQGMNRFKNILVNLISQATTRFPFSGISNISFFRNQELLVYCTWMGMQENKGGIEPEKIFGSTNSPGCIIYNSKDYMDIAEVEIKGFDTDGKPFILFCPVENLLNKAV